MCSHIIIFAVTLKLVEFPQASMQIPIGQNRKRGRPNKTKKALVRQNENKLNEDKLFFTFFFTQ
jgi:hypothetical protein